MMTYYQREIQVGQENTRKFQKVVLLPLIKHPEFEMAQRTSITQNSIVNRASIGSPTRIKEKSNDSMKIQMESTA